MSIDGKGIVGIYSLSTAVPIKIGNFETRFLSLADKTSYKNWMFRAVMPIVSASTVTVGNADHGSRLAVSLEVLRDMSTIAILRVLLIAIERFGKPRVLRTDNGSQFRSLLFRLALALLGIRQQFSKPGMPWMNGRVEKLFGALKERLNQLSVGDLLSLEVAISEFRAWYNLLRPHHHLAGRTPFEAWRKIDPYRCPPKHAQYIVAWDGLLRGYYLRY